jgi:hypothetical protein
VTNNLLNGVVLERSWHVPGCLRAPRPFAGRDRRRGGRAARSAGVGTGGPASAVAGPSGASVVGTDVGIPGFLLDRGRFTTIAAPGVAVTFPFDINDHGQVVGYTDTDPTQLLAHGFLLDRGRFIRIDVPKGPAQSPGASTTAAGS